MPSIQEEFNFSSGDFTLPPGEYEGPLVIRRPCVLDGSGATLWADRGPVLVIGAPGVTVRGLRVEVTGQRPGTAIQITAPGACLQDVEAAGNVVGLPGEAEDWRLPTAISLGEFAADRENEFAVELEAAAEAELRWGLRDVEITPQKLLPGKNYLFIRVGPMRDNTILYGDIFVHTAVTRRVCLTGKALIGAAAGNPERPLPPIQPAPPAVTPPAEVIAPLAEDEGVTVITRGQRIPAGELARGLVKVAYAHRYAEASMEIDPYVFLLGEDGKVRGDRDLIFFGNPRRGDGAVETAEGAPLVLAELSKLESWVSRLAVCFAIYGEDPEQDFSRVDGPVLRVFHGGAEIYRFPLSGLTTEKAAVALEFYRYKGAWKLNFVGSGYRGGLRALCEGYGVEVE